METQRVPHGQSERVGNMSSAKSLPGIHPPLVDSTAQPPRRLVRTPSFEEIFTEYQPLVYGIALKFSGSREDAEDIVQEVFTKVWKSLEEFNFSSTVKTWIYRISINTCIDYSRKSWRKFGAVSGPQERARAPQSDATSLHGGGDAERRLLSKEVAGQVRRAITRLKPHLKAVLILKDLEEMSYEEISSVLGLQTGTISSRLNRARKALQSILRPGYAVASEGSG